MNAQTEIESLERQIKELKSKQSSCFHEWGEVENANIYKPAYTIEGDPVGTMGIDWRGPCYVPAETIEQWKRTCKKCGYVQFTKRKETVKIVTKPVF